METMKKDPEEKGPDISLIGRLLIAVLAILAGLLVLVVTHVLLTVALSAVAYLLHDAAGGAVVILSFGAGGWFLAPHLLRKKRKGGAEVVRAMFLRD